MNTIKTPLLLCFIAIKTGRYTYEKKTKIIKEVKRLELARQAAPSTQPSSDNVVALSKLPQQITDNKYEVVIEHILAAFQEHQLFGANFHADMKQSEETYLARLCVVDYIQAFTSSYYPSSLACPVIWGLRYSCLYSSSMLPCLLRCPLSAPPLSYTHLSTVGLASLFLFAI